MLSREEVDSVDVFRMSDNSKSTASNANNSSPEQSGGSSIVKRANASLKRKFHQCSDDVEYMDLSHVKATSNSCERLFSQTKLCLSDKRKSLAPRTLNMIMMLKFNHWLWNILTIDKIIGDMIRNNEKETADIPPDYQDIEATRQRGQTLIPENFELPSFVSNISLSLFENNDEFDDDDEEEYEHFNVDASMTYGVDDDDALDLDELDILI
jgi:hypothetical protein